MIKKLARALWNRDEDFEENYQSIRAVLEHLLGIYPKEGR